MKKLQILLPLTLFVFCYSCTQKPSITVWPREKAMEWSEQTGWMVGCNYIPATAVNELEMWQPGTFDPETIDRELGWAESIGFNTLRVFLHNIPWEVDPEGFKNTLGNFLSICEKHNMKVMFVLFDDCWYGNAESGPQPDPDPGLHNSYWLQCPRYSEVTDRTEWVFLKSYAQDIVRTFAEDKRVAVWDVYNEPGNNHHPDEIFPLVQEVFAWVREVNPSQPLTSGIWQWKPEFLEMNHFILNNSDIISFHNYSKYEEMKKDIERYQSFDRPVVCTEYIARGFDSRFETHLPLLKRENTGAINWGLVFGKTQTVYPWGSPLNAPVPEVWHHDIFWPDGKPYSESEIELIRSVCLKN